MKYASPSTAIYVDGYDLTPGLTESMSRKKESITQPTAPFGTASEVHSPVGMTRGVVSVGGGIFDEAVDPLHAAKIADGGVGVSRIVCFCDQGQTKGKHFTGYEGAYSQTSEVLDANNALTKANVTYQVSGQVDEGVILQEKAAKTEDWTTETTDAVDEADNPGNRQIPITSASEANPTVITTADDHHLVSGDVVAIFGMAGGIDPDINDNPAAAEAWKLIGHTITVTGATTFTIPVNVTNDGTGGYCVRVSRAGGGVGYLQVLAGSGFTNFVGTVRHSVDNSVWADLVVFTDTEAVFNAKERKATAAVTTVVRRYLAFKGDVTGVGTITVFAGFARG